MTPALESKKAFDPRDADAGASQEHKSVDQTIREARDTVRASAEPARQAADTAADVTRRTADQGREAVMSGLRAMAGAQGPLAEASYSQGRQFLEASAGITKAYRETTESTAEDVQALVSSYAHFGLGLQQMQHAYFDLLHRSLERATKRGARKPQDLLRSTSLLEFAEVQRDLYRDAVGLTFEASTTMLRLASQVARDALQPLDSRARDSGRA
jgi:hypothetical protein